MKVIDVAKLSKRFGKEFAVFEADFEVKKGSITGFLGPNGAGKSTTINVLLGFIAASSGEAKIFDKKVSVSSIETRESIGFLSSTIALDKALTAGQEIEHFGHLAGGYDKAFAAQLAKRLGLDLGQKVGALSTGNYQKVGLVIALMHQPKLLILDEPTNGLDPIVQAEFNKILLEMKKAGSTVFISSHILSEVDEICDEFIFIRGGKIVAQLSKAQLSAQSEKAVVAKPNAAQRQKLMKFLKDNKISHQSQVGDLESIFMRYYEDESDA